MLYIGPKAYIKLLVKGCIKDKDTVIILSPPRGSDTLALYNRYYKFKRYIYIISKEISRKSLKNNELALFFPGG